MTVVVAAWAKYQFGLIGTAAFVGWRTWHFFDLTSKVQWAYGRISDLVESVEL